MKDGSTHLAHKAEHAVDMETGAVEAVVLHGADQGDTATMMPAITAATANLREVADDPRTADKVSEKIVEEAVADKGYHSNDTMSDLAEMEVRSYVSEPNRGQRDWEGKPKVKAAVYANRRRMRGKRGKKLMKKRGELIERTFAHNYETQENETNALEASLEHPEAAAGACGGIQLEPGDAKIDRPGNTSRAAGPFFVDHDDLWDALGGHGIDQARLWSIGR